MRETWRPAAAATPTGAAESHSYWPPAWTYTSASPSRIDIVLAPAEPIGTSSPPRAARTSSVTAGGRVRLTTSRGAPSGAGGTVGGRAVDRVRSRAGSATAAATTV